MFPFDASATQIKRSGLSRATIAYRMRWKRRRLLFRSWRHRHEITATTVRDIPQSGVLVFSTMRNEMARIEHWLGHYRELGVSHFFVVDNESDDGTAQYLEKQADVSLWSTGHSYKRSRFGVDWLTCLQTKFGTGRWCLTVDADELLVYPNVERHDMNALTKFLDQSGRTAFGALMLDMYPKGRLSQTKYVPGENPIEALNWFDAENYRAQIHPRLENLYIQGGVRDRLFFSAEPARSPTLNKTPLVKWKRGYAYVSSTHHLLPRKLNDVYDLGQGNRVTGVLLHTKFLPNIGDKSAEELVRGQHFEKGSLYRPYYTALIDDPDLWSENSVKYDGPDQLEALGLMTSGNWGV